VGGERVTDGPVGRFRETIFVGNPRPNEESGCSERIVDHVLDLPSHGIVSAGQCFRRTGGDVEVVVEAGGTVEMVVAGGIVVVGAVTGGAVDGVVLMGAGWVVVGAGWVVVVGGLWCRGLVLVVVGGLWRRDLALVVVGGLWRRDLALVMVGSLVVVGVRGALPGRPGPDAVAVVEPGCDVCFLRRERSGCVILLPAVLAGWPLDGWVPVGAFARPEVLVASDTSSEASVATTGTPAPVLRSGISGRVAPTYGGETLAMRSNRTSTPV
jgi:hypothetical protein